MSGVYTYSYLKYEANVSGATHRGVSEQTVHRWIGSSEADQRAVEQSFPGHVTSKDFTS